MTGINIEGLMVDCKSYQKNIFIIHFYTKNMVVRNASVHLLSNKQKCQSKEKSKAS